MKDNQKRVRLDELQLARAFAIIAVLLVHSTSSGVTNTPRDSILFPIYSFFNTVGKLGTPTFIMLSGFVLFYNYFPRKIDLKLIVSFYKKRLKFILIPYVLFSALYFGVKWYLYYDYPSIGFALKRFIELLSIGKAHTHLYFVFISVQFYILFPFLLLLFKRSPFIRKYAIWIGIGLQWLWVILNKNYFQIENTGSVAFSYMAFYFIGAYLGVYYFKIRDKMKTESYRNNITIPMLIGYGSVLALYTGYMYLVQIGIYPLLAVNLPLTITRYMSQFMWTIHALFAGAVLFYLSHIANKQFSPKVKLFFMEIGATSFGIYLIHPLFLLGARLLYSAGPPLLYHGWQVVTLILITALSWASVRLTVRFVPHAWIIFGQTPKMQTKLLQKK